jgi:hypothetical protein
MMEMPTQCPACLSPNGASCVSWHEGKAATSYRCDICGEFEASSSVLAGYLHQDYSEWTPVKRAALVHILRTVNDAGGARPMIMSDWLRAQFEEGRLKLPTPAEQAINIIRYLGDHISEYGEALEHVPNSFFASVGSANHDAAMRLVRELIARGTAIGLETEHFGSPYETADLNLTLDGWAAYEAERHGLISAKRGFMALKFDDPELDPFLRDVIKPAVASLGYTLEDMRDAATAGLIDNVMRAKIRDAAFVLVDLTHANLGAYWEAGFAEGLGKTVLYLCKRSLFDSKGTHFDTNHCTTVMWEPSDPEIFKSDLIATLRRSLGIFGS